jgi:molybdate transport system ATP-binding protein
MNLRLSNIVMPLADFTLELNEELRAPVTAIFGPSGAGKTSLLDLVAGLRRADSVFLQLDGEVLTDLGRVEIPLDCGASVTCRKTWPCFRTFPCAKI